MIASNLLAMASNLLAMASIHAILSFEKEHVAQWLENGLRQPVSPYFSPFLHVLVKLLVRLFCLQTDRIMTTESSKEHIFFFRFYCNVLLLCPASC